MPTQRLSMRRIREVLRLRHQGLTERVIARTLGVSNGVVHGYVRRARLAGLTWPLPEGMDDEGLELLLFPAPAAASQSDRRPAPDWVYVEKELRRRSVTRLLLWEEYRAANPDGFGYTWFCTTFEAWKQRARPSMRQTHVGGEKVFVDFAGDTIDIFDPITGEAHAMKLSRRWGPRTIHTPKPARARAFPTGLACTQVCSGISAACRSSWSAIISRLP
jgi:transposase